MELGMNHAGEIRTLVDVATPEVRVWTNVGEAHIGYFGSADAIADAKGEILEGASSDTLLVANADDPLRDGARAGVCRPHRDVRHERAAPTSGRVDVEDLGLDGSRARLVTPAGERQLAVPLLGRGHLMNVLAAAATALEMGVDLDAIVAAAATLKPSSRRGAVLQAAEGRHRHRRLVQLEPVGVAAIARRARPLVGRRVASRCVGEMLELGELSLALHQECGRAAAASRLWRLVTIGGDPARALGDAAIEAGMPRSGGRCTSTPAPKRRRRCRRWSRLVTSCW